jgi:hypothetical protein
MKEFISKNEYYLYITGREKVSGDVSPLTSIQKLLQIRYRRKAKMNGYIQYLTSSGVISIELSDMIRKQLVCSEAYLEANRAALSSIDPLKDVVIANEEPHVVYEFWIPSQNFQHENKVVAYLEVAKVQGYVKVMVKDVVIYDHNHAEVSDAQAIYKTVGGLHISMDSLEWQKGEEMAAEHEAALPPVEFKGKYFYES